MIISDYQSFYNLVKDDNPYVGNLLGNCITVLNKICSCNKTRKSAKAEECNRIYIDYIQSNGNGLIEYFKTKTNDAEVIFNHNTHHLILKLKLR